MRCSASDHTGLARYGLRGPICGQRANNGPSAKPRHIGSRTCFWFLCGWLGGPSHYEDRFGHPRLRARHLPFPIGIRERDDWLACMTQAMDEEGVPAALRERLQQSFHNTADWMRNRAGA